MANHVFGGDLKDDEIGVPILTKSGIKISEFSGPGTNIK